MRSPDSPVDRPRPHSCSVGILLSLALLVLGPGPASSVSLQPGWPQATGDWVSSSPALGDLDGDGRLDAVVGSNDGKVYAWHHDGSAVSGWPQTTGDTVGSDPVLGDLDGDGDLEVVTGADDGNVYAWHHGGTAVSGWPQTTGAEFHTCPALGDLDGDGELEVVVGSSDGSVYAWHHDGSPVTGWPQTTGGVVPRSTPLGDLDGDGNLEVVAGSWDGKVYAWHYDGMPVAGWPVVTADSISSSPALGDVDGDGDLEVVIGSWGGRVYAWHHDGSPLSGWPQVTGSTVFSSPALGDLDGDGTVEVVVGADKVYAWHHEGSPVAGWPQVAGWPLHPGSWMVGSSPALGDVDGDGKLEVVVGSQDTNVYAWHDDGAPVTGWPQNAGGVALSSPALGDLDADGDVEVVVGSGDSSVYAWSCDALTDDSLPWPMFHHDPLHTGMYGAGVVMPGAHFIAHPVAGPVPLSVTFADQSTDHPSSWSWAFGDGATSAEQNPVHQYTTAGRYAVSLSVVTDLGLDTETKQRYILALFPDVLTNHWAWREILACVDASVVQGYPNGNYQPTEAVTRAQMAVYIARAIATPTGDEGVPDPPPGTQSFSDVPADHWAYKWIEYAVSRNVVQGYPGGAYHPDDVVNRGQMAVYVARAVAGGDDLVPEDTDGVTFTDVTDASEWAWCYRYVEYCAANAIVQGYADNTYRPANAVTRDQMAVYIQRAFGLPM